MPNWFTYDLDALADHARNLKHNSPAKLYYACKANPLSQVLKTIQTAGFCFDVASSGELQQVLSIGVLGQDIIMTGPAKSEPLLRLALNNQVGTFVIESLTQLNLLTQLAKEYAYQPKVLLRLQLQWKRTEKSVLGGNEITPFGMDLKTAAQALERMTLPFLGFHVFQWGNILEVQKLRGIWQETLEVCRSLKRDFQVLDVGGGLGIPYRDQKPLSWDAVSATIQELKETYQLPEFWLELGRYLTGPYGTYTTTVVDRKTTYGKEILVLEGGINHLARSALVGEAFPVKLERSSQATLQHFALHGPLCTSLDSFGEHLLPADTQIGDTLVFSQVGAYGFTESMPYFLCHDLPGEAVIHQGKTQIIREVQSARSWLK